MGGQAAVQPAVEPAVPAAAALARQPYALASALQVSDGSSLFGRDWAAAVILFSGYLEGQRKGRERNRAMLFDEIQYRVNLSMACRFDVRSSSNFPRLRGSAEGRLNPCSRVLGRGSGIAAQRSSLHRSQETGGGAKAMWAFFGRVEFASA